MAVAGFGEDEINVEVKENALTIQGEHRSETKNRSYLHRGIAARQFQRAFVLAEGIEVAGADLDNGLLSIDLVRPRPEVVTRTIKIRSGSAAKDGGAISTIDVDDRSDG